MTGIHVAAYDCVTCLGGGYDILWKSLLEKRCGFKPVTRFFTGNYVNHQAGCISELDELPHGGRFPVLLEMLGQRITLPLPAETFLLTATTKDNIELHEQLVTKGEYTSDASGCCMVDYFRRRFNIHTPSQNINTACTSASAAVLWAAEMIAHRQAEVVIICAADMVSEFVFSGFSALKAMSATVCKPFDARRDGLILGEAAAYVILTSEERLKKENWPSCGRICGWGISSDAFHITAPNREGRGLQRAIRQAIQKASLEPQHIGSIHAHGTGTIYNDAMEIAAFRSVFEQGIPDVYAIKGAIGHTLGPCGLIEMMVSLISLQQKLVPPVTGLEIPEPDMEYCLSREPKTFSGDYALSVNSGFGGINTALVMGKA